MGDLAGFFQRGRRTVGGLEKRQLLEQSLKTFAVFGAVDGVRAGAEDGHARAQQRHGEVQRRLAAELDDHAVGPFLFHNVHHVFKSQRLEIEAIGRVVVGGNGLGVGVDHDGLNPGVLEGEGSVAAAVVELDALPDAVGAAAEDDDLFAVGGNHFLTRFIGRIEIGSVGFEFRGAGIHQIVGGHGAGFAAQGTDVAFGLLPHFRKLTVGETEFLGLAEHGDHFRIVGRHGVGQRKVADLPFHIHDFLDLAQEPRIDQRDFMEFFQREPDKHSLTDGEHTARVGCTELTHEFFARGQRGAEVAAEADSPDFQRTQPFLERFLESPANGHGLTHALHGGGQFVLGSGELLKGEAGNLDHAVVDGGFEGRGGFAGNVVAELVQRIADGQLGRDLGDGEAGRLGSQRGGTGHAGVHLDDHEFAVSGIDAELHVRSAGLHTDFAHDGEGGVAHLLIFAVREGLRRGHGDGVAGVHAHGVHVFDGAHDHAVVRGITHDFHLKFFPADDRLLDHDFAHRAGGQAVARDFLKVFHIVGDTAARAAERKGGADDHREGHGGTDAAHVVHIVGDGALRDLEADVFHRLTEQLAAFGLLDDFGPRADEFRAALGQHAGFRQRERRVQARLPAESGQDGARAFLAHDGGNRFRFDRFDVGAIRKPGVGHDGRRVGVHQYDLVSLFFQGLDALSPGIVEFARLADDDRARTDYHDLLEICTLGHIAPRWARVDLFRPQPASPPADTNGRTPKQRHSII